MTSPNLASSQTVFPLPLVVTRLLSGENAVYTVPASRGARLDKLILTNVSGNPVILSTSLLPAGVPASVSTRVGLTNFSLPAGDAITVEEVAGWVGTGITVSVFCAVADAVVAKLSGLEFA